MRDPLVGIKIILIMKKTDKRQSYLKDYFLLKRNFVSFSLKAAGRFRHNATILVCVFDYIPQ